MEQDRSEAEKAVWEKRREAYLKGESGGHPVRGGLAAYDSRLSKYVASLVLGREFGETAEHYFERKGLTKFIAWANATLEADSRKLVHA